MYEECAHVKDFSLFMGFQSEVFRSKSYAVQKSIVFLTFPFDSLFILYSRL
jgi:hypothetical protein